MKIDHNLYTKIKAELNTKLENYFDFIVLKKNLNPQQIIEREDLFNENNKLIEQRFEEDNIKRRKLSKITLGIKKTFAIGDNRKKAKESFEENKNTLAEFETLKIQKRNENTYLKTANMRQINSLLCGLNPYSIIESIFNEIGLPVSSDWNSFNVAKHLSHDQHSMKFDGFDQSKFNKSYKNNYGCFKIFVRNNPVYFVQNIYEKTENIETNYSVVHTYQSQGDLSKKNSAPKIKSKTITANHSEPTPYDYFDCWIMYYSNYLPELNFSARTNVNNIIKNQVYKNFDNKEFATLFNVLTEQNDDKSKLNEFFNITAQQNLVNLSKSNNLYNMLKSSDGILLTVSNKNSPINREWLNKDYTLDDMIDLNKFSDLNELKKLFVSYFRTQILEIIFGISEVLAINQIATEKYTPDAIDYVSSDNLINSNELVKSELNAHQVLNKGFFGKKTFYATSFQECNLFPGFSEIVETNINNIHRVDFMYTSYRTENETDPVQVRDPDCGLVVVPVPYVRYYPEKEAKRVYYLDKKMQENVVFKVNSSIKYDKYQMTYDLNNVADFFKEKIIIENFENIKNVTKYFCLLSFLKKFKALNQELNQTINIQIDKDGIYMFVNEPELIVGHESKIYELFYEYASFDL